MKSIDVSMVLSVIPKGEDVLAEISPGAYSVEVCGRKLMFDFEHLDYSIVESGESALCSIIHSGLDVSSYCVDWLLEGFLTGHETYEEIEEKILAFIKDSKKCSSIYIEVVNPYGEPCLCEIHIHEFKLMDNIKGEQINLLSKEIAEDALPEGVYIKELDMVC